MQADSDRHSLAPDVLSKAKKPPPNMRIAITGATGFVGRYLARDLIVGGHEVVLIAPSPSSACRSAPR
jgi:transposase